VQNDGALNGVPWLVQRLKGKQMADSTKSGIGKEDIEGQIKTIREDVTGLMALVRGLSEEKLENVTRTAKAKTATVEDYIVEKPVQSAIIALLVGIIIGFMSRR
jgi:ElaB/YqjD/DUF883 family membrane-anchored ribosome-binding protein